MKKITLFSLSLAGLAMFALPHSAKAFELQEVWRIKGGGLNIKMAKFFDLKMAMK